MEKHQISDLLVELQSNEAYMRNDAIKKIIRGKIDDEQVIATLNNLIENDSYISVRNFARSALDVLSAEHSAMEETEAINIQQLTSNEVIKNETKISFIVISIYLLAVIVCIFLAFDFVHLDINSNWGLVLFVLTLPWSILVSIFFLWSLIHGASFESASFTYLLSACLNSFIFYNRYLSFRRRSKKGRSAEILLPEKKKES